MQSCAVQFFRPLWKWVRGLQGSWVVLFPLLLSIPTSQSHSWTCAGLYCAYLQEQEQGCFSRESADLRPHGPFSSYILFFLTVCYYEQSLCVITSNPWLGPQHITFDVWYIQMSPYLLGFCKEWCKLRSLMSTFRTRENLRCAAARSSNIYLAFVVTFWSYIFQV